MTARKKFTKKKSMKKKVAKKKSTRKKTARKKATKKKSVKKRPTKKKGAKKKTSKKTSTKKKTTKKKPGKKKLAKKKATKKTTKKKVVLGKKSASKARDNKKQPIKTWGGWRSYNGNFVDDDQASPSLAVMAKMLSDMGYESASDLNNEINKHQRYSIPENLQSKIRKIFDGHGERPDPIDVSKEIHISDGCVSSLRESVSFENPLIVAKDPDPFKVFIAGFGIEELDGYANIYFRGAIFCDKYFQPASKKLVELCVILIDKVAPREELSTDEKAVIAKYLEGNGIKGSLAEDEEFIEEIAFQLRHLNESMGQSTKDYIDTDNEDLEVVFYGEDDEIGFS